MRLCSLTAKSFHFLRSNLVEFVCLGQSAMLVSSGKKALPIHFLVLHTKRGWPLTERVDE